MSYHSAESPKRRPPAAQRQLRRKVLQAAGNDLDRLSGRFEQETQRQAEAHRAEIEQIKQFAEERCAQIVQRQVDHDNQFLAVYEDNLRTVLAENEELRRTIGEAGAEIERLRQEKDVLLVETARQRQRINELETELAEVETRTRRQRKEKRRWNISNDTLSKNRSGDRRGPG